MTLEAIKYSDGRLRILDQILLPKETKYIDINGVEDGWHAIHTMQVSHLSLFLIFIDSRISSVALDVNPGHFIQQVGWNAISDI